MGLLYSTTGSRTTDDHHPNSAADIDLYGLDDRTMTACQLSKLSAQVQCLESYNSILIQHIEDLEKECMELRNRVKEMEEQHHSSQGDAADRKLYTSMMETNNRFNEGKLKELKQENDRLKTSNKRMVREYEEHIREIRKEHALDLQNQDTVYQTILEHMVSQNRSVVEGLRESIVEKNTMMSAVMRHFMAMHRVNADGLMAKVQSTQECRNLLQSPNCHTLCAIEGKATDDENNVPGMLTDQT